VRRCFWLLGDSVELTDHRRKVNQEDQDTPLELT